MSGSCYSRFSENRGVHEYYEINRIIYQCPAGKENLPDKAKNIFSFVTYSKTNHA